MSRYRKAWAAFAAALVATIPLVWDQTIGQDEAVTMASMWLGVFGVFLFPNDPPAGEPADPGMSERGPARDERGRFVRG